jgi:putative ABC transport system permease protein
VFRLRQFLARSTSTLHPQRTEREISREITSHLALIEEGLRLQGLSPREAALEARRQFGGVAYTKELHQDERAFRWLLDGGRDLRHAVRSLRTRFLPSSLIVVALALGIGLNGAMFSIVRALLLRPLTYAESDRLLWIWSFDRKNQVTQWASYPDFQDWQAQSRTVEHVVGWGNLEPTLTGVAEPERLQAITYVGDLFGLLGVPSELGRLPPGAGDISSPAAVINDSLWRRQFGANDAVIGSPITLSGQSYTVAAVMPSNFRFPPRGEAVDVWLPLPRFNAALARRRDARLIEVIARRKPDVTVRDVQAEFDVIGRHLAMAFPASNQGIDVRVVSAVDQVTKGLSRPLTLLVGAVALLLALACVNIINLLLIGGVRRRHEIGIRHALGASRRRVASMLSAETLLLCAVGGVLAAILAIVVLNVTSRLLPPEVTTTRHIEFDLTAGGFLALISIGAALIVGIIPAWMTSRVEVASILQQGTSTVSASRPTSMAIRLLLIAQVALATTLVLESSLFLNSYFRLSSPVAGLDPQGVLTFDVSWPSPQFRPRQAVEAFAQLQGRLLATPGVVAASAGFQLPDRGRPLLDDVLPFVENPERPLAPSERRRTGVVTVQSGFFRTMRMEMLGGRDFTELDQGDTAPVGIVNQSLAKAYFPNQNAVGRRLILDAWTFGRRELEIVAVVADVTHGSGVIEAQPLVYLPLTQYPKNTSPFVVRTNGDSTRLLPTIRTAAAAVATDVPLHGIDTLQHRIDVTLAQDRLNTVLLVSFSLLALLLAATGVYGVVAYGAAHRTYEIAIRRALGADAKNIWRLVTREAFVLVGFGLAIGIGAAIALAQMVSSLLFGVRATDPLTYGIGCAGIAVVALSACWRPARRATKPDVRSVFLG